MPGGSVRFTLDDGEMLIVAEDDLRRVYEELWRLAPHPGAVSAAAVVHTASHQSALSRIPIELTTTQSAALREAVALLEAER